jgi:hypothetical protein
LGRALAGVMGPLAFIVVVIRSMRCATPVNDAVLTALVAMIGFAIIGAIAGLIASAIITDAVREQVAAELASAGESAATGGTAG